MRTAWQTKTLGDVCSFENGDRGSNYPSRSKQVSYGIPFINAGHLSDHGIEFGNMNFISKERYDLLSNGKIRAGDILFCLRGSLGKFASVGSLSEGAIASSLVIVRPGECVLDGYLLAYFRSDLCAAMISRFRGGAAQPNLSAESLRRFTIPVPPITEQKRIIGTLDEAFAAVATARANTEQNVRSARELSQSELSAIFAVGGPRWIDKKLGSITTKIGSGATPRGGEESYKSQGIPLIRSLNVHDLGFRYPKLAFLDEAQAHELSNVEVKPRDVLLNITGASVARCCLVPGDVLPARVNQHVSIIRPDSGTLDAGFLHYMLISEPYKRRLLRTGMDGGSTRQAITKAEIQEFVVSYPATLEEQETLVARIEEVLTETQDLEAIAQRKLAALDALKQSLLHQAFTGAL